MLFSIVSTSQAELWELVIDVNVEKKAIYSGDSVIITGKVVDQAYKPIRGAEVFIMQDLILPKHLLIHGEFLEEKLKTSIKFQAPTL